MNKWHKLTLVSGGALFGNGLVITNWTHIVWFDPLMMGLGLLIIVVNWRE